MIPHGVEIFVGLEPIDLRWSFDRLAGIVAERIGREARSGALFVFFGKRREAIKVVFFDGTGMGGAGILAHAMPGSTPTTLQEQNAALEAALAALSVERERAHLLTGSRGLAGFHLARDRRAVL